MEIINARPEHFPQIYSLICELEEAPLDRTKLEAVYLRNLTDPGIHYLVALENGEAAGFASVHIHRSILLFFTKSGTNLAESLVLSRTPAAFDTKGLIIVAGTCLHHADYNLFVCDYPESQPAA